MAALIDVNYRNSIANVVSYDCSVSNNESEGTHYFPEHTLKREYLTFSNHKTTCPWKGEAHYYSLMVNGDTLPDAVWFYPEPKPEAHLIQGRVAF